VYSDDFIGFMSINSIWNRVEIWKWLLTCKIQVKFDVEISEICQFRVKILNYEKNDVIISLWCNQCEQQENTTVTVSDWVIEDTYIYI
jgi:hypothetical protein